MNRRSNDAVPEDELIETQTRPKLLTRIKNKIKNFFFPKTTSYVELPVYETTYETNNKHDSIMRERSLFDKHIDQLMSDTMNNTDNNIIDLEKANDENVIQYIQSSRSDSNSVYKSTYLYPPNQFNSSAFVNPYANIFNSHNEYYTNDTDDAEDTDDTDEGSSLLHKHSHVNSDILLNSNYIHSKLGYK
jgi:hypothetical protein